MDIPEPYIIDKIRRREEGDRNRQPVQIPLRIEVPRYDQPNNQYGRREPPREQERGVEEITFDLQPIYQRNQGGLEYRV